jgi:hypothetical protein
VNGLTVVLPMDPRVAARESSATWSLDKAYIAPV